MRKANDFGKRVKIRLIEMDRTQAWLITEVRKKTGKYVDTSYMWKILNGVAATPGIVNAIREILDLKEDK